MPHTMLRGALRAFAVLTAVAALVDPVMTVARSAPRSVVMARLVSSGAGPVERALRSALPDFEWTFRTPEGRRLPCAQDEPCVIVADGSVAVDLPDDLAQPVSVITVGPVHGPNVGIRSAAASIAQHAAASGSVRVAMTGAGVVGRRTRLRINDGAATVGSAVHEWKADGDAVIDVPWWPLGEGPRALRVEAVPFEGEASALDNAVNVGVTVSSTRQRVLVFDPRPSWASTFVRRALEDDPRFLVEHQARLGPSLAAGTAGGRLDRRTLDAASAVIVGAPDGLRARDVDLLDRFVRRRGGTLILLPDRAPSGAVARLFDGRWSEHLETSPSAIGALQASETLRLLNPSPVDDVLGSVKGSPAIVLSPAGDGAIVVSGAMDAWRYRDADGGAFDRFWRSVVLESAAAGAPLRLDVATPIAVPGSTVSFEARYRRMEPSASAAITATAACGGRPAGTIRLWPKGPAGVFAGTLAIDGAEACEISVTADGVPGANGGVAVTTGAMRSVAAVMAELGRYASSTGGVTVAAGDEASVAAAIGIAASQTETNVSIHPMQSPWWMLPFVACLSTEWWLRRRAGLR